MSILKFLLIEKNGRKVPLQFQVRRLLDAGYTGRNQEMVMRHVEELKSHGVAAPEKIPAFYPVPSELVTTDDEIEVLGAQTSGEVEVVFLFEREVVYIGVGSDHTDRELEKISIAKSKVMCPKVISKELWSYDDIKRDWDRITIRSWIEEGSGKKLYQEGPLSAFLPADELIRITREQIKDGDLEGMVLFSGTLPTLQKELAFSGTFLGELLDESLKRKINFAYRIKPIDWLSA